MKKILNNPDLFVREMLDGLLKVGGWERKWDEGKCVEVPRDYRRERASHYKSF